MSKAGNEMEKLEDYVHDNTQGPRAAISATPGLIQRQYYAYYPGDGNDKPLSWKQTLVNQINFLDQTNIPVTNGYVDFSKKEQPIEATTGDIKIGYQANTQVTFGYAPNKNQDVVEGSNQIVHQVYTAAVDFVSNNKTSESIAIAQIVLEAAYEGTLRAAALNGKKKVFLSLIGGGVFANDFKWISDAIAKQKDFITESGLEVTLVIFDSSSINGPAIIPKMEKLVKDTGGTYTRYSNDNPDGKIVIEAQQKETPENSEDVINLASALSTLS